MPLKVKSFEIHVTFDSFDPHALILDWMGIAAELWQEVPQVPSPEASPRSASSHEAKPEEPQPDAEEVAPEQETQTVEKSESKACELGIVFDFINEFLTCCWLFCS